MSHYDVLGVSPEASPAEVRRAYLALARRHHPDRHAEAPPAARAESERTMQRINEAWLVLGDRNRRAAYDEARRPDVAPIEDRWVPGTAHPDFVPFDDGDDDVRWDLADDEPFAGARPVPRWQQLLPVALLVASLASLCVGLVINLVPLMTFGMFLLVAAGFGFLLTPILAVMRNAHRDP